VLQFGVVEPASSRPVSTSAALPSLMMPICAAIERGRRSVIAGDHFHLDAGGMAGAYRADGARARRVDHADQAEKDQVAVDRCLVKRFVGRQVAARQRQHAQAARRHEGGDGFQCRRFQRRFAAIGGQHGAAGGQQLFDGTLGIDHRFAFDLVQGRHGLARRIEGQFVTPLEHAAKRGFVEAGLARDNQQRGLGRVAGDLPLPVLVVERGIVAQQAGEQGLVQGDSGSYVSGCARDGIPCGRRWRTLRAWGAASRPGNGGFAALDPALRPVALTLGHEGFAAGPQLGHCHRVLGQGAGLVRADHRGAAQGLDRRQVADDGATLRHAADADGQGDAHRRGQALRDSPYRQRHRCHQHVGHGFAPCHAYRKCQRGEAEDHPEQQSGELAHLARQRRGDFRCRRDQAGDAPGFGVVRGSDHQPVALAGDHGGAGIGHVAAIGEQGVLRQRFVMLVDRRCLAGKRRFHGAQLAAGKDAQVGWYLVAGTEPNHVTRHQMHGIHAPPAPGTNHGNLGCDGARQRRQRGFRLAFLQVADHRVDHDHAEDYRTVDPFAERGGDHARADQHQHQRLFQLRHEALQRAASGDLSRLVGAVAGQARSRLVLTQAVLGLHAVMRQCVGDGQGVPVLRLGFAWRCGRRVHATIMRRPRRGLFDRRQKDTHRQAATTWSLADGQRTAVQFDDAIDDGQAQAAARCVGQRLTGSGGRARVGAGATAKALAHRFALGGGDAAAVIGDAEHRLPAIVADGKFDLPRRAVFEGVLDQVAQRRLQQRGVAAHGCVAVAQHQLAIVPDGVAGQFRQHLGGQRAQAKFLHRWRLPGIQPRQGEQLGDQARGAFASSQDLVQGMATRRLVGRGQCHLGLGLQGGQRRTQFVCGIGGEAALVLQGAVDFGEELVQALDQWQDFARRFGAVNRRQPFRRALGNVVGESAQGAQRKADRDHQYQGQARQGDQHRLQQVLGDLAGQVRPLLLHVRCGRRRVVEQFLDFVQGRTPGEDRGQ
jgi:hypothetical protein